MNYTSLPATMLQSIHSISNPIQGVGHTDAVCLPCSGALQHSSYRHSQKFKSLSLQCTSRNKPTICNATSSNNRRSPHFSRQNKHGFSRDRNRQSEAGDSNEKVEESETFSSKDGPILSSSGSSKFQATTAPGPREREIVQLFRKVQAQLRERAATTKEERKIDESQKKNKPTEAVDSLLKLLRKHSVQDGNKTTRNDSNRDFIVDQSEQNGIVVPLETNTNTLGSSKQEIEAPVISRPRSNFQRRSPVPQVLPEYSDKEPDNSTSHTETLVPELEIAESDFEATFSDDDNEDHDVFEGLSDTEDDEISKIHEDEETKLPQQTDGIHSDLSGMKLIELRELAKTRGLKGYSKLKKHDLVELLTES